MSKQYGELIPVDIEAFRADPRAWLAGQMSEAMPYLLAHADDGVIWGKRQKDGTLMFSGDVFEDLAQQYPEVVVRLRAMTLQEARIFGLGGELRVWRTEDGFAARLLTDTEVGLETLPNEHHLLWHQGHCIKVHEKTGFALLQEGAQGQRHAPPITPRNGRRPTLVVRHYVDYDGEGQAYIALSRLVGLEV